MCGLAGMAGTFIGTGDMNVFKQLMILAGLRGHHSSGVFMVGRPYKLGDPCTYKYHKEVTNPFTYLLGKGFDELDRGIGTVRVVAGHARYATKGEVTVENAHPFVAVEADEQGVIQKEVIGMHNGTLFGEYDYKDKFDTDSEALINNIMSKGLKPGLEHVNNKGGGAYALVLYDNVTGYLTFLRNKERPLWIMRNKSGTMMYWASEKSVLEFVRNKNFLQCEDPWMLKENTALIYDVDATDFLNKGVVEEAVVSNQRFFPITNPTYSYSGTWKGKNASAISDYRERNKHWYNNLGLGLDEDWEDDWKEDWRKRQGETSSITSSQSVGSPVNKGSNSGNNIVPYAGKGIQKSEDCWAPGFQGEFLLKTSLKKILNKGCTWCSSPQQMSDLKNVLWISKDTFACIDCKETPHIKEFLTAAKAAGI